MNMLKKGPDLKLPAIKVPDFLIDLYYDLRERHLLPLAAVLVVGLVAVPIVLSQSSGSARPESDPAVATPSTAPADSSALIVAKAAPGLREYRRRLANRAPADPFEQQYTAPDSEGGATASESAASGGDLSPVPVESTSTESTATSPETPITAVPGENSNGEPTDTQHLRYYSFAVDVRIVPGSGGASSSRAEPSVRHNLPELTMLPSRKTPALTFMGVTKDGKKALMMVSDNVKGLFGDGICVVGSQRCQLMALETGVPETVVYGGDERTYRVELLKIRLLTSKHLDKAALGNPKHKGH